MGIVIWSSAEKTYFNQTIQTVLSQLQMRYTLCQDMSKFPPVSNGDIVLSCGSKALAVLQVLGVVPKNRSIASLRGKQFSHFGAKVFVTYDPMIVNRDYGRMPDVQWDTQLAARLAVTGSLEPVYGDYRYVESLHELIEKVEEKYAKTGRPVEVACDLETKGLVPYDDKVWIITCQFTVEKGKSDVLYFEFGEKPVAPLPWKDECEWTYWEGLWVQLDWIFKSPMVSMRGANFKFDMTWLKLVWGISVTNFKFDTMLVGSLLNENRSNSLKLHAKIMTQMGGYEDGMEKYDFGCLERVPRNELLLYAGGDTDVTYQVAQVMKEEILRDKALSNFYVKLVHPASLAFEKLEQTGVLVDQEYYHQLQQELQVEIKRIQESMLECLPNKLRIKYKDDIATSLREGKSPFKPKVLLDFLFTSNGLNLKPKMFTDKTKAPSTAMDHLMMFGDDEVAANFIGLFKELGSASKTLSTFVIGFLKHLRRDGRLHATYMLHRGDYGNDDSGTTTGRTSAKDPAIQTLPKHSKWAKRLRKAFIAPPGKVILNVDYSQGELRICAVVANEPTMIKAYQEGMDLHALTAAQLSGYEYDEFMALPEDIREELRYGGKAGNFGLIYGMQHRGFKEYAYQTYGVKMTDEEAYIKREKFFELYSMLPGWHEKYKGYAHQYQMVRSPLGRIRHLPLIASKDNDMVAQAERQAINSPIQSCLSDMMQLAMAHIQREYGDQIQMFMMTHDSLSSYVPENEAELWAKRMKEIMENLPLDRDFNWNSPLKFYVDAETGLNLAELKKLKNL